MFLYFFVIYWMSLYVLGNKCRYLYVQLYVYVLFIKNMIKNILLFINIIFINKIIF